MPCTCIEFHLAFIGSIDQLSIQYIEVMHCEVDSAGAVQRAGYSRIWVAIGYHQVHVHVHVHVCALVHVHVSGF